MTGHTPDDGQRRLLAHFARYGRRGFHIVRSAEAPRAGQLVKNPSRFKPAGADPRRHR